MTKQVFETLKIGNSIYKKVGDKGNYWCCQVTDIDRVSGRISAVGIKSHHYSRLKKELKKTDHMCALLGCC